MKKILIVGLGAVLLSAGCKTKEIKAAKLVEKERETYNKRFDSLIKSSVKNELQWGAAQKSITDNLVLQSVAVLDSSGVRQPFHYKHYVDGVLKEEIHLQGGELTQKKALKADSNTGFKSEFKGENTRIEVDVGVKKATENTSKSKEKEAKTAGFQFGFYAWLFAIVIVVLILRWIANKLKLPLTIREVKKPPDI